jgi:DNA invertase Pin-like site-specific DNA recombinase
MKGKFIAYYRVSTTHQGINGLGMDAQRAAVRSFLNGDQFELLGEFAEVESGKHWQRPELDRAIALCRKTKARLLIAKLDRLARNAAFLLNLRDSGVDFVAVDMPHADKFTVGIMALVAEKERDLISDRTKAGLAAAKRRGTTLGNPKLSSARALAVAANQKRAVEFAARLAPVIARIEKAGVSSLRQVAECLNARGFQTPNGKEFTAQSVKNLRQREITSQLR